MKLRSGPKSVRWPADRDLDKVEEVVNSIVAPVWPAPQIGWGGPLGASQSGQRNSLASAMHATPSAAAKTGAVVSALNQCPSKLGSEWPGGRVAVLRSSLECVSGQQPLDDDDDEWLLGGKKAGQSDEANPALGPLSFSRLQVATNRGGSPSGDLRQLGAAPLHLGPLLGAKLDTFRHYEDDDDGGGGGGGYHYYYYYHLRPQPWAR